MASKKDDGAAKKDDAKGAPAATAAPAGGGGGAGAGAGAGAKADKADAKDGPGTEAERALMLQLKNVVRLAGVQRIAINVLASYSIPMTEADMGSWIASALCAYLCAVPLEKLNNEILMRAAGPFARPPEPEKVKPAIIKRQFERCKDSHALFFSYQKLTVNDKDRDDERDEHHRLCMIKAGDAYFVVQAYGFWGLTDHMANHCELLNKKQAHETWDLWGKSVEDPAAWERVTRRPLQLDCKYERKALTFYKHSFEAAGYLERLARLCP